MQLDIKLTKTSEMFCEEGAIATIAVWKKRHFEMSFLRMLGFGFNFDAAVADNVMGKYLSSGFDRKSVFEMAEYYHGIRSTYNEMHVDSLKEMIKKELEAGMPFGLYINYVYCDWTENRTDGSYILIIGYENDDYYCYDIHGGDPVLRKISVFAINKLMKENPVIRYNTFSIVGQEKNNITFETFIDFVKKSGYMQSDSTLNQMLDMADFIENCLDFEKEVIDKNPLDAPLFVNFLDIVRARLLLVDTLNFIYQKTFDQRALECRKQFLEIAYTWKAQWLALYKTFTMRKRNKNRMEVAIKEIANGIRNVARQEYELFSDLEHIKCTKQEENVVYKSGNSIKLSDIDEIDLNKYYNNKAFLFNSDKDVQADLTGYSEYFFIKEDVVEIQAYGQLLDLKNYESENDNISCQGQNIEVNSKECKDILVIAAAEWGSNHENMQLYLEDNRKINIKLDVPDWYECNAHTEVVMKRKAVTVNGEDEERAIYGYLYELDTTVNVKNIKLPYDSKLHIFRIYFSK